MNEQMPKNDALSPYMNPYLAGVPDASILPVCLQPAVQCLDAALRLLGQDARNLHRQRAVTVHEDQRTSPGEIRGVRQRLSNVRVTRAGYAVVGELVGRADVH